MNIPILVILLTLTLMCYGALWHDATADQVRKAGPQDSREP